MIKLCVGADDIEDLRVWQKQVMRAHPKPVHHTRMVPKRGDELLAGGSLYWVIKGLVQVRQRLVDVREISDRGGRKACELVLDPEMILVEPTPKRPFQGWRYLKPSDVPPDLKTGGGAVDLPSKMLAELREAMVW